MDRPIAFHALHLYLVGERPSFESGKALESAANYARLIRSEIIIGHVFIIGGCSGRGGKQAKTCVSHNVRLYECFTP